MKRDPVVVTISSLHADGYGVTESGDFAVLGALPTETVTAVPFRRHRRCTYSRIQRIETSAADRVQPKCAVADVCGGCSLQHLDHEAQISHKQAGWLEQFAAPPAEVLPPMTGPLFGYRSKARLGLRYVEKKGRVLVGFREQMNRYITDMTACEVLRDPVGHMLESLGDLVMDMSEPGDIPQIEVAVGDSDIALVVRHLSPLSESDLLLWRTFAANNGLMIYLQPTAADIYRLYPTECSDYLYYDLPAYQLRMHFKPLDFTQVNHAINRKMVDQAPDLLAVGPQDTVLDAFSGIGNFSLALARQDGSVIGVEPAKASVDRARYNAQHNEISNVVFLERDLFSEDISDVLVDESITHVLIDPPRSGAELLVEKLAESNVLRVVYVSCNPRTLARDASILIRGGYQFEKAGIIDMFPHTNHVESMALFTRSASGLATDTGSSVALQVE